MELPACISWIPQGAGTGLTQMRSKSVRDTANVTYSIIVATIEDEIIYVISGQEFTIDATDLKCNYRI